MKKLGWVKKLRDKENPNDKKRTDRPLALHCINMIKLETDDIVLDPFLGDGAFYEQYPSYVKKDWCEIDNGRDFFEYNKEVDWIISNPPYSKLNEVFKHSVKISRKGIGLLIGIMNLTPQRCKILDDNGFGITKIYLCNVRGWFGKTILLIAEKDKESILDYDIEYWTMPPDELKIYKKEQKEYQSKYWKKKNSS